MYNYQFSVPPGLHSFDVTIHVVYGISVDPTFNATVAIALQKYLTSFAQNGVPSGEGFPTFPSYGPSSAEVNLDISGFNTMTDPTDNPRCLYWQKALFHISQSGVVS